MVLNNGSNCNYHFIVKEIVNEFKLKFNCLGDNTEKCKTFLVPITKEVKRIHKNRNKIIKTISYKWVLASETRRISIFRKPR